MMVSSMNHFYFVKNVKVNNKLQLLNLKIKKKLMKDLFNLKIKEIKN